MFHMAKPGMIMVNSCTGTRARIAQVLNNTELLVEESSWAKRALLLALLLATALIVSGCILDRILPPKDGDTLAAEFQWACPTCLPEQPIGYTPLTVVLFAQVPDDASSYAWDLGDGTIKYGRFISHTYHAVGLHQVTLRAKRQDGRSVETFEAIGFFRVLPQPATQTATQVIDNRLVALTITYATSLSLGERGLVCLYATPKVSLEVLDVQSAESRNLIGQGQFFMTWIKLAAGKAIENCVLVRALSTGPAFVEYNIFASDGKTGERSIGRAEFTVVERNANGT